MFPDMSLSSGCDPELRERGVLQWVDVCGRSISGIGRQHSVICRLDAGLEERNDFRDRVAIGFTLDRPGH